MLKLSCEKLICQVFSHSCNLQSVIEISLKAMLSPPDSEIAP
ncbi:hypothetical protein HMPREF3226_00245 [Prevotella corporis]|uniref:Uncharacterized protein n=1 Tax=Prevotella corporis TaxID=28128 RepID=A0A133QN92_9BACT|nr:hypothetical protein HMPREF3226_00245 [Prevotella corporis]